MCYLMHLLCVSYYQIQLNDYALRNVRDAHKSHLMSKGVITFAKVHAYSMPCNAIRKMIFNRRQSKWSDTNNK